MTIDITVAVAATARVGEGPFWDAAAGGCTGFRDRP